MAYVKTRNTDLLFGWAPKHRRIVKKGTVRSERRAATLASITVEQDLHVLGTWSFEPTDDDKRIIEDNLQHHAMMSDLDTAFEEMLADIDTDDDEPTDKFDTASLWGTDLDKEDLQGFIVTRNKWYC